MDFKFVSKPSQARPAQVELEIEVELELEMYSEQPFAISLASFPNNLSHQMFELIITPS